MRPGRRECDNPAMSESPYERGTTHFGFQDVPEGENPLLGLIPGLPRAKPAKKAKTTAAKHKPAGTDEPETTDNMTEKNDE